MKKFFNIVKYTFLANLCYIFLNFLFIPTFAFNLLQLHHYNNKDNSEIYKIVLKIGLILSSLAWLIFYCIEYIKHTVNFSNLFSILALLVFLYKIVYLLFITVVIVYILLIASYILNYIGESLFKFFSNKYAQLFHYCAAQYSKYSKIIIFKTVNSFLTYLSLYFIRFGSYIVIAASAYYAYTLYINAQFSDVKPENTLLFPVLILIVISEITLNWRLLWNDYKLYLSNNSMVCSELLIDKPLFKKTDFSHDADKPYKLYQQNYYNNKNQSSKTIYTKPTIHNNNYSSSTLLLNVPYEEKDIAKKLGAYWNPQLKKWYSTSKYDYPKLKKWISKSDSFYIILDYIYIVEGIRTCFKCGHSTRVIAFGIEHYIEFNGEEIYDKSNNDKIHISSCMTHLPKMLMDFVQYKYNYRKRYSKTTNTTDWANGCDTCDALQGNHYLYEEVDSPFWIEDELSASKLKLYRIPLEYAIVLDDINIIPLNPHFDNYMIKKYADIINYPNVTL